MDTQKILTEELIKASEAYYNGKDSGMSDLEFDRKVEELRKMEQESGVVLPGSPTVSVGASVVSELKVVRHKYPALSLDKVKYKDREDLIKWLNDAGDVDFGCAVVSWKCDGLTTVLHYMDGRFVQAVTRGDGIEGSDITHNARFFKGVPETISYKGYLVVRGETVMEHAEFERINALAGGTYENARNLAAATAQMLDSNESRKRRLRFKAFELVCPEPDKDSALILDEELSLSSRYMDDRFRFLELQGFDVVDYENVNSSNVLEKIEDWKEKLSTLEYPTDGLVFSYNDLYKGWALGSTGRHPRWTIAMKWTDETVPTTIRDIEWSVGKTGIITPVAIFDQVRLGLGSNVTRASLHNLSIMNKLGIMYGSKAEVYLANMIIPQIASCEGGDEEISYPLTCPVCGQDTYVDVSNDVSVLRCTNKACAAQTVGMLMNTFSKDGLFIKGLGESQIEDLLETGLVNSFPLSFYELANEDRAHNVYPKDSEFSEKVDELISKDGWGMKKWTNLMNAIEASRDTTLQKFLYSLNIPLLGNDLSKKLSKFWNHDINQFVEFVGRVNEGSGDNDNYGYEQAFNILTGIDGIGDEKAKNVVDWMSEITAYREIWEDFITYVGELRFPASTEESSDASLEGLTFVITGSVHDYKNRDEFKASVESRGGKVSGSVSSKTNYLVCNSESESTKSKKARDLGIEVLTEDEFIARFGH